MTGTPDWAALAAEVRKRRERLRLPVDLVDVGGPAEMTVRKIESGQPGSIRPKTKTRLEHALRWRDGLADRILDGTATPDELDEVVVRGFTPKRTGPSLQEVMDRAQAGDPDAQRAVQDLPGRGSPGGCHGDLQRVSPADRAARAARRPAPRVHSARPGDEMTETTAPPAVVQKIVAHYFPFSPDGVSSARAVVADLAAAGLLHDPAEVAALRYRVQELTALLRD